MRIRIGVSKVAGGVATLLCTENRNQAPVGSLMAHMLTRGGKPEELGVNYY